MLFQKVQQIYTRLINMISFPMFIIDESRNTLQLQYCAELPPTFGANDCPFLQLQVCDPVIVTIIVFKLLSCCYFNCVIVLLQSCGCSSQLPWVGLWSLNLVFLGHTHMFSNWSAMHICINRKY